MYKLLLVLILLFLCPTSGLAEVDRAVFEKEMQEFRKLCESFRTMLAEHHELGIATARLQVHRDRVNQLRESLRHAEQEAERAAEALQQNEIDLPVLQKKVIEDPSSDVLLKALYESIEVHKRQLSAKTNRVSELKSAVMSVENDIAELLERLETGVQRIKAK